MSESPPSLRDIAMRPVGAVRRRFTQWVAELGSSSRDVTTRIEEVDPPQEEPQVLNVDGFNDAYDTIFDDDGEPVSLSASSASRSESWAAHQRREAERHVEGLRFNDLGEAIEHDKFYKGSKKKKELSYIDAMTKARAIQERHPKRLLCGGLALRLYGVLKRDKFSDLDFVTYEWRVVDNEVISMTSSQPYLHCLFLSAEVEEGKTIHGLKLQNLKQILYWKQRYGRDKDKKDLQEYLAKQFFKEEDFNL